MFLNVTNNALKTENANLQNITNIWLIPFEIRVMCLPFENCTIVAIYDFSSAGIPTPDETSPKIK
jgi:hypothetical protein